MDTLELYLATTNPGKLRDFAHALAPGYSLVPLPGLAGMPVPDETADTFRGNAEIKAVAYSLAAPGLLVLADDSGLEADALGGAPGVRSARYADDCGFAEQSGNTHDQRNNACLQAQMLAHPGSRLARYRCTLALARNGKVLAIADGTVEGRLLEQARGSGGFGYDALFLLPEPGQTMAEIDAETRQHYSHRAHALAALFVELDARKLATLRKRKTSVFMAIAPVVLLAIALLGYLLTLGVIAPAIQVGHGYGIPITQPGLTRQAVESMLLLALCLWAAARASRNRAALLTCGGVSLALLATAIFEFFDHVLQSEVGISFRILSFAYLCAPLLALAALGLSGTIRAVRSTVWHDIAQTRR